jgi:hypothetical protein
MSKGNEEGNGYQGGEQCIDDQQRFEAEESKDCTLLKESKPVTRVAFQWGRLDGEDDKLSQRDCHHDQCGCPTDFVESMPVRIRVFGISV